MSTIKSTDNVIRTYQQTKKTAEKALPEKDIKPADEETKAAAKKTIDSKDSGIYTKDAARKEKLEKIPSQIAFMLRDTDQLIRMVRELLQTQGRHGYLAKYEDKLLELKDYLENGGTVTAEEQAAAVAAIANDGPWGVEAVSDRLVEAALKISGGDESKFKMMKSAIEAGFKAAEAMWGGELPEISYKTFEATMKKLEVAFNQVKTEPE